MGFKGVYIAQTCFPGVKSQSLTPSELLRTNWIYLNYFVICHLSIKNILQNDGWSNSLIEHQENMSVKCIPRKPHFYIVKMGFAVVFLFFVLILIQNIDCGYSL